MKKRIWNYPGIFIAWGMALGAIDIGGLINQGYRWFALETPQLFGGTTLTQQVTTLRAALKGKGCYFGIWQDLGLDPSTHFVDMFKPNFFIANVEGPVAQQAGIDMMPVFRKLHPALPAAVITNFGGIDEKAQAKPWIDHNFVCIPEAYQNSNPMATGPRVIFEAVRRGWKEADVFPCYGVWGGYGLVEYHPFCQNGYSVYLAEGLPPIPGEKVNPSNKLTP